MKTFFITGTDTGCGKTYITCKLLEYFAKLGKKAFALKPIATGGFVDTDGSLINEDVLSLTNQNEQNSFSINYPINGWLFPSPISPHLAAKEMDQTISVQEILNFCKSEQFSELDYLLIEGAGGLLVPLNDEETWLDFLKAMNIPIILVVGMRLGCINHALLTDSVLQTHQISCTGWIANCIDPTMLALQDNIQTLSQKIKIPLIDIVHLSSSISTPKLSFF